MLADDQRKNSGVGATVMLPLSGIDMTGVARQEGVQLVELSARGRDQRARLPDACRFALRHASIGSPPFKRPASLAEFFLRRGELARRDGEQRDRPAA